MPAHLCACLPACLAAAVLTLSERLMQEADSVPVGAGLYNSSGSILGHSIPHSEDTQHGLRLLLFSAAADKTLSSGSSSPSSSLSDYGSPAARAADAGSTKQLQVSGVVQLLAFCIFEVLIGMFWPSMMTLRAKYVPEQQRSTIINVFRIPLNLFVCLILWKVRREGWVWGRGQGWALRHVCVIQTTHHIMLAQWSLPALQFSVLEAQSALPQSHSRCLTRLHVRYARRHRLVGRVTAVDL